jgi:hypothetical protein
MTKEEAQEALKEGRKITHFLFSSEEYICKENEDLVTEDGYLCNNFFKERNNPTWDEGYEIYYGTEKILCAAIHYENLPKPVHSVKNKDKGLTLCGHDHAAIIGLCTVLLNKKQHELQPYEQGFLTSENRFVDRKEAWEIAVRAKQLMNVKNLNGGTLYSEDINYSFISDN